MTSIEEIYREYLDFVFRICNRYTRDREEAEDLTQEAFVKINSKLADFRGDSQLSTWIYRLTANCCLDYLRKRKREREIHVEYLDEQVVRNISGTGDQVLARIDLDRILSKVRPSVRQMLFLTLAEGLTYAEAAAVLKMTPAAVAKGVARFLEKSAAKQKSLSKIPAAVSLKPSEGFQP